MSDLSQHPQVLKKCETIKALDTTPWLSHEARRQCYDRHLAELVALALSALQSRTPEEQLEATAKAMWSFAFRHVLGVMWETIVGTKEEAEEARNLWRGFARAAAPHLRADLEARVKELEDELRNIATANPRKWEGVENTAEADREFRRWAQNRARHTLKEPTDDR